MGRGRARPRPTRRRVEAFTAVDLTDYGQVVEALTTGSRALLPHRDDDQVSEEAIRTSPEQIDWKTRALVDWAAGRPFSWVDDEITDTDRRWVRDDVSVS